MSNYVFPVPDYNRISSGIGSRSSPGGIGSSNHQGIDIAAPLGSDILAPTDLTIISAGVRGGLGNAVIGQDISGNQYVFGHMQDIGVAPGQQLLAGSQLGTVGSTGRSTGPHLHFAIKDKAGKFLANQTEAVINKGMSTAKKFVKDTVSKYLNPSSAIMAANPVAGIGAKVFGLGGKSWIDQLKDWLKETKFFQRLAIVILALVLIWAAFYLFGSGKMAKIVKDIK